MPPERSLVKGSLESGENTSRCLVRTNILLFVSFFSSFSFSSFLIYTLSMKQILSFKLVFICFLRFSFSYFISSLLKLLKRRKKNTGIRFEFLQPYFRIIAFLLTSCFIFHFLLSLLFYHHRFSFIFFFFLFFFLYKYFYLFLLSVSLSLFLSFNISFSPVIFSLSISYIFHVEIFYTSFVAAERFVRRIPGVRLKQQRTSTWSRESFGPRQWGIKSTLILCQYY